MYYLIVRNRPEDLGYHAAADDGTSDEVPAAEPTETGSGNNHETSAQRYLHALTNQRFMIACIAIGFQSIARYGLILWVPVHFLGASWKKEPGGRWISLSLAVGMAVGALTSGWLSDKLFNSRRSPLIAILMALAAVSTLGMFYLPQEQRVAGVVLLFVCGFCVYGPQSGFWALCPDLLGHRRAGTHQQQGAQGQGRRGGAQAM